MLRVILLLALLAVPALAEPIAAKRRFLGLGETERWTGVGRLNARGGFCTAALIAPDKVLTAAHCLYAGPGGERLPLSAFRFVAGSRKGQHGATRRVIAAETHPDWRGMGRGVKVAGDIAILTLESPISFAEGRSYETGPAPDMGDDVFLLSYGRDRETALSIQAPCQVLARFRRAVTLNCDVTYGASGSPVFRDGRIVAVISAMSTDESGRRVAHAALFDGGFRRMTEPTRKPGPTAGAKFSASPRVGTRLPGAKRPPKR